MPDNRNEEITQEELEELKKTLSPLVGMKIDWLSLPEQALLGFEPSQIAVIVNTLIDGILPQIELLATNEENQEKLSNIGLSKAPGGLGQRESYPDYIHISGKRVELKGLFVDNNDLKLKRPPTRREPSARLKENVTMEVIEPKNDVLLIAAVQLKEVDGFCSPHIVDIAVLSMVECIRARDERLTKTGGKWIGKLPKVISKKGAIKLKKGIELTNADYEKDTNFGKLKSKDVSDNRSLQTTFIEHHSTPIRDTISKTKTKKMNIKIKPLTKDLKNDYLFFFDNMIFKEEPDWASCYCIDYHFTGDVATCTRDSNRSGVIDLIEEDKMTGYLVFENDKPIGWCNANNRLNYQRLLKDYDYIDNPDDQVCSIVCFLIHPDYRRQGIAQQILEKIIMDYSNKDYDYIEAYPRKGNLSCARNFKGPLELYKRYDFRIHKEHEDYYVMRKRMK